MNSASIDFIDRPLFGRVTLLLLFVGLLASVGLLGLQRSLLQQRDDLLAQRDARQQSNARVQRVADAAAPAASHDEAERLVVALQRPWDTMLDALQTALRDDVVIQRMQPEADAFRLRIVGQADSSQAVVDLAQRLQVDPAWTVLEPLSEARQPEAAATGGKALAFQMVIQWTKP